MSKWIDLSFYPRRRLDVKVGEGMRGVEAPEWWSDRAISLVSSKYLKRHPRTGVQEDSVFGLVERVVSAIGGWAEPALGEEVSRTLAASVADLCLRQKASFNSPVWFNIGAEDVPQQASACFILSLADSMESLQRLQTTEAFIYKMGSGCGSNFSVIRGSGEPLSSGGTASGPVSFMRGFDSWAGGVRSGGATRRAAKIVILNADHPDILEFIRCKAIAERAAHALVDAGFSADFNDPYGAYGLVSFQNGNHTVRVTDVFMRAVEEESTWDLRSVLTGETVRTVEARDLFREIAEAAWTCGDPGLQFHDTINGWHTCPSAGPITATNPCGEYTWISNNSCNLASLNLLSFLSPEGVFDLAAFDAAISTLITAQDVLVGAADYPTQEITENTRRFRALGLGYANLHALLMAMGLPYDSEEGRLTAAAITSFLTATAYRRSAELARDLGPFDGFAADREAMLEVVGRHRKQACELATRMDAQILAPKEAERIASSACLVWEQALSLGEKHGYRNAQVTLLAPTGTISFMMECDSTGIEPIPALLVTKVFVGGEKEGETLVARVPERALRTLGYGPAATKRILAHVAEHGTLETCTDLKKKHLPIFDCAMRTGTGREISPMGHLLMVAAVQPFLSGAISKTVNIPTESTVEDIEGIYREAWKRQLKSVTVYRNGCKRSQPLSAGKASIPSAKNIRPLQRPEALAPAVRRHLPQQRPSITRKFSIAGLEGYVTAGLFPDRSLGELFLKVAKDGSLINGLADVWAQAVSIGLQYGIPLEVFVEKFKGIRGEPAGFTGDEFVQVKSIPDYMARWLDAEFLSEKGEAEPSPVVVEVPTKKSKKVQSDAPLCHGCGNHKIRDGACWYCPDCAEGSGCGG